MDLDYFRAVARSAPWRWRTVRVAVTWRSGRGPEGLAAPVEGVPVRAWVDGRRGLRVEDLATGRLLMAEWSESPGGWRSGGRAGGAMAGRRGLPVQYDDGGLRVGVDDYGVDDPRAPQPQLRGDGLVASRPPANSGPDDGLSYDGVLWQTYRWVAMLDPVELADGAGPGVDGGRFARQASRSPVRVTAAPGAGSGPAQVEVVDHHDRPAWQAFLIPTEDYDPRCSCCPLLPGEVASRSLLAEGGLSPVQLEAASAGWPSAHRVRLDAATGIVVELEQIDGDGAGGGWTATIEAVDEQHDRSWFTRV